MLKEGVMLKIGEFARLSQVSMKTLRHYDNLGLLRPSRIDQESGYRLYEMGQLADMMRILALKDCGFALEEIGQLLRTYDEKEIETLLNQRVAAQQVLVAQEQARLQRLVARVKQLASTREVPLYDVALKRTEPLTLVGLREDVASSEEIGPLAWKVWQLLQQRALVPVGPLVHLYFDAKAFDEGFDLFVGAAVAALPAAMSDFQIMRLPEGEQVACVLYRGDYPDIRRAYIALNVWLETSGYRLAGPCREIYHRSPLHTQDPASYLTEIQSPIAPVK
jgi:DNA-binding transcriptional MerR regulator